MEITAGRFDLAPEEKLQWQECSNLLLTSSRPPLVNGFTLILSLPHDTHALTLYPNNFDFERTVESHHWTRTLHRSIIKKSTPHHTSPTPTFIASISQTSPNHHETPAAPDTQATEAPE